MTHPFPPTFSVSNRCQIGVKPFGPGFVSPQITPPQRMDRWNKLSGGVPTPGGLLHVEVEWGDDGSPSVSQTLEAE